MKVTEIANTICTFMFMKVRLAVILLLWAPHIVKAQLASPAKVFENGTLILQSGDTLRAGAYLLAGKGSGENQWYKSLGFANYVNLPYMLNRNYELKSDYNGAGDNEYQRNSDKIKSLVTVGDSLLIKRIKRVAQHKYGTYYTAILQTLTFPKTKLSANIDTALFYHELVLPTP